LTTMNDEKVIRAKTETVGESNGPTEYQASEIRIRVRDQEAATEIAAEFKRAITLCQAPSL